MSSLRRIASSRANGAKSHGPATEIGRRASSRNAITHGLTAQTVVLAAESTEEFDAHLRAYIEQFQPRDQAALDLVYQLAAVAWRIVRFAGIEARLIDEHVNRQDCWDESGERTGPELVALAFKDLADAGPALSLLNRYQARLHHEYQRILMVLRQMERIPFAVQPELQDEPLLST